MKKWLVWIVGLLVGTSLYAQTSVSGSVRDKEDQPLQGCAVWFIQADSLAGGSITDAKGNFVLKGLEPGEYTCRVSIVGYKKAEQTFSLTESVRLPRFVLEEDVTQLSEVLVEGDKRNISVSKAGATTFFLSDRAKQAQNTYEALVEIPKLIVNPIGRTVNLNTGESPLILIDGVSRPGYMDVLNPELIESVEVIETPSARYLGDESVTCILNIHLKRTRVPLYWNGNIYGQQAVTSKHGVFGGGTEVGDARSSLYLNLQHFYFDDDKSHSYTESQSGDLLRRFKNQSIYNADSYYIGLGGDRIFSEKNYAAFTLKYIGNPDSGKRNKVGEVGYVSEGTYSEASGEGNTDDTYHLASADLYYKHTFNKQHSLEFTGNYSYSSSTSVGEQEEQNGLYHSFQLLDFDNSRHSAKLNADYTYLIGGKHTLVAGSNTSYATNNMDDLEDELPVYTYSKWQEYLYAGFDNNRSGSKFNYTFSLGVDMLFSRADGVKNHYIDLLPVAALSYKFNQKHTLSFRYQRLRYSPSLNMLNPRNTSTDSLYIQQGNPLLTPSYQDRIRLSYKLSYKKLYVEPYVAYTYSSKLISPYGTVTDNIYTNTYKNFLCANFLIAGTSIAYNLPFGNINFSGSYQKRYQQDMVFNGDTWNFNLFANFYYKKVSLMVNAGYGTTYYDLHSKTQSVPWSNATFSWSLPKGWQLKVMSQYFLFTGMKSKSWFVEQDYRSFNASRMTDRTPMFLLGFSYNFKNKVENKWRQKKQFYETDSELQNIGVK